MKEKDWSHEKTGLTHLQKDWIKRAWKEYWGEVQCIFPKFVSLEFEGVYDDCNGQPCELHHVEPQGYSKRVLNRNPDRPENIVPLCKKHHRLGDPSKPMTRAMQEVIHLDSMWANKNYKGKIKPTSYDKVNEQRKKITDRGEKYWYSLWDSYLQIMATEVVDWYVYNFPEDEWPIRK